METPKNGPVSGYDDDTVEVHGFRDYPRDHRHPSYLLTGTSATTSVPAPSVL